uniref:TTF-type domain-containing protein n=1 Tax=Oryza glaberrima TaxID=4538 RepID=I1R6T0_ORYGL
VPQKDMSGCMRRFNPDWFKTFGNWLEYSIVEDASYCLCCYLFKNETLGHGGGDAFSTQGFRTWKFDRFKIHIGGPSSVHNQNVKRCDDLMNQQQSIRSNIVKQEKKECSTEVGAVVLKNAPKNFKLVAPEIQRDIVRACAEETLKAIIEGLGDEYFAILVDESRDEKQAKIVEEALQLGELETGRGLNQELGLKRAGDTRWGSHFNSLLNMIVMFPSVVEVIDDIAHNGSKAVDRLKAKGVLDAIQTFDFSFMLHLMKQDIVKAILYLGTTKRRLQDLRNDGWEGMFNKVIDFCIQHDIELPDMDDMHVPRGSKSKRKAQVDGISNEDYYQSVIYAVIDLLRVELNDRFSESSTVLLLGVACLDPADSFS